MTARSEEKKTENHVDISETRRTSSRSAASLANLRIAKSLIPVLRRSPDRIPPNTFSKRGRCTQTLFQLIPVLEEGIKRPRSRLRTESSEVKKAKQSDEGEREPLGCVTNSPAKITSKRARSRGAEEEPRGVQAAAVMMFCLSQTCKSTYN